MDVEKLNPVSWMKTIAEVLETVDNSHFISYLIVYFALYFVPEQIKNKLLLDKYIAVLSIVAMLAIVVIFARVIRSIGRCIKEKYKNIILIIDAIKELKLMVHAYYPLENKILELLTKKNLRKFELDILNKQFFQQDIEDFNRDIEENCLDYEDDLTEYGRKLLDKYGLDPYEFNKEVIAAVQKLQDRKIISLNGCTYSISFGVWHYHMFWLKRIYSFFGTKFDNLRKKLRLKYRNFKKFIDKVLFDIKDKFKSLLGNLLNAINKIFNKNKTM